MFGILGLNKRNLNYIKKRNPKKNIRLANNKYKTKKFLHERGIPVPETYELIANRQKLFEYDFTDLPERFVIKPNHGSKGKGIMITSKIEAEKALQKLHKQNSLYTHYSKNIPGKQLLEKVNKLYEGTMRKRDNFVYKKITSHNQYFKISGEYQSDFSLKKKLVGIIDGQYTLGGKADQILIEEILEAGDVFDQFCEYGLADIRVITFNLVPIAAMLRMPTLESDGKANLAQGGIGFGIDISTGKIITMKKDETIYTENFPEEYSKYKQINIPHREEILLYSSNIQYFANIGYLGIDRVITRTGPKLLEINARAGLEIQNIAQQPLEKIMKKIADLTINTPGKGVEITKSLFSKKKSSITPTSKTIYLSQQGTLSFTKNDEQKHIEDVIITVNPNNKLNYISPSLARKLNTAETISLQLSHNITIKEPGLQKSDNIHGEHISLGRNSIQKYVIKPIHKAKVLSNIFVEGTIINNEIDQLQIFDQKIHDIAKQFSLTKILKPTNYLDEFDRFITRNGKYNPQFTYDFPEQQSFIARETDIKRLRDEYHESHELQSPLAQIFYDKLNELENKIGLLQAFKIQDYDAINHYNQKMYGEINVETVALARIKIESRKKPDSVIMGKTLNVQQANTRIRQYLKEKNLTGVKIIQDPTLNARVAVSVGSRPKIKLLTRASFKELELEALLAHEIDVHLTRFINGQKTGRHIFRTGTAGYITTEEGLAIHAADQVYSSKMPGFDSIGKYKNYLMIDYARTHNFVQMCSFLETFPDKHTSLARSFRYITKFKRGIQNTADQQGVFYKNKVYLDGFLLVKDYTNEERGKLTKIGKISKKEYDNFTIGKNT